VLTWDAVIRSLVIAAVATVIALAWEFPTRRQAIIKVILFVIIVFAATVTAEIIADLIEVGISRAFPQIDMEEAASEAIQTLSTAKLPYRATANQKASLARPGP